MNRVGTSDDFEGVLGSFKYGTVDKPTDVTVNAKAVDKGGRTGTGSTTVLLHSAQECGAPKP